MSKLELIVADHDKQYLEMISHYVNTSEFADRFVLRTFSDPEALQQFMVSLQGGVILLVNSNVIDTEELNLYPGNLLLHLTETNVILEEDGQALRTLYKYQPLNQLLAKVFATYVESNGKYVVERRPDSSTKIVSLFSAVGSCGKTVTAMNLAKHVALQSKRVFYLNLELLNSTAHYLPTADNQHFSQLLYYLHTDRQKFAARFEALKAHEPRLHIDYFDSNRHMKEIAELTGEGAGQLVEALAELGTYDVIVADLGTDRHDLVLPILRQSDFILWLLADELSCLLKTQQLLRQHGELGAGDVQNRTRYVLNKYLGSDMNIKLLPDFNISARLPYIPQWKAVADGEQLLSCKTFNDHIQQLADTLAV